MRINIFLYKVLFFLGLLFFSSILKAEKISTLESIPLYIGIQYDHVLEKSFRNKKLKFEGLYRRYTKLKYNSITGVIRFFPKRKGISAINIKDFRGNILKKITIKVGATNLRQVAIEIQSLLRTIDGIQVKILNNKIVIDGEILVPRDIRRIHDVTREYKGQAISFVTLSPLAQKKIASFIEKEINNENITVRATNMIFILEGFVSNAAEKNGAEEIAEIYLPDYVVDRAVSESKVKEWKRTPILNRIKIREKKKDGRSKLIQLVVHYVELNKDYADSFRFQWTPQIADGTKFNFGNSALGNISSIISGTINNFLPKLNWGKSFGFARILHSANIITEEGKKAMISSNKQTPYQGSSAKGEQVVHMETTGINMSLTPHIVGPRGDSVQLSGVSFTVTNLVGSVGSSPITTKRTLNTNIHVQNGLSAVMGGIISNESFTNYNRAPPQSSTNPLLTFLASKGANRSQSQFIVFVTPIIKISASSGVQRIKKKFKISQ